MGLKKIKIKNFVISNADKLTLIAGPCVIESKSHALEHAEAISKIAKKLSTYSSNLNSFLISLIKDFILFSAFIDSSKIYFSSSFDKSNH